ncbi:hypothetical protein A2U01_0093300, partial [Trifolium medium]|nr:hypothetical protein [Trifolium medium]
SFTFGCLVLRWFSGGCDAGLVVCIVRSGGLGFGKCALRYVSSGGVGLW